MHEFIKTKMPRYNVKVERSHRKDQKRFCYNKVFCNLENLRNREKYGIKEYNKFPIQVLN